jgi:hypothetical protein
MAERFRVRVCYATPAGEVWREIEVEQGATISGTPTINARLMSNRLVRNDFLLSVATTPSLQPFDRPTLRMPGRPAAS